MQTNSKIGHATRQTDCLGRRRGRNHQTRTVENSLPMRRSDCGIDRSIQTKVICIENNATVARHTQPWR